MSLTGEGRGRPWPGPWGGLGEPPGPPLPGVGLPRPGAIPGTGPSPGWGRMRGGEAGPVSLEVPVLQVAVLKGEAFLLPLAPLLVVKVDVGALAGGEGGQ